MAPSPSTSLTPLIYLYIRRRRYRRRCHCRRRRNRSDFHLSMLPTPGGQPATLPPPAPEALLALIPNLLPLSAHRCSLRKDFSFLNDVFKFLLLLHTDTYTRTFATTCE